MQIKNQKAKSKKLGSNGKDDGERGNERMGAESREQSSIGQREEKLGEERGSRGPAVGRREESAWVLALRTNHSLR